MMRRLLPCAIALCIVVPPRPAVAQAPDWTFQVPLQMTMLPPEIAEGVVVCAVGPDAFSESFANEIHDLRDVQEAFGVGPGDPIPEWPGLASDSYVGTFLGFQTFAPDRSGSAPSSVQVGIAAPDVATDGIKGAARSWACAVGFRLVGSVGWWAAHPDFVMDQPEVEATVPPAEGTRHVLVVVGTLPRG